MVEPSLTTRKVVELAFEEEDVEIIVALTGAEALEQVRRTRPTIMLASLTLPDMSGIELCRAIGEELQARELPAVLLVGRGEQYDEGDARSAGVVARLSKPLDSQELVELVEQHAGESPAPPSESAEVRAEPAVAAPAVGGQLPTPPARDEPSPEEEDEGAVTEETPAQEAVSVEGEDVETVEIETDFDVSLRSLSEELFSAEAAASESSEVEEIEAPPYGEAEEGVELAPELEEDEAGIMLEKASDDEIRHTLSEDEEADTAPSTVQVPPDETVREPGRARKRPEPEGDLLERLLGERVWRFTEEIVRDSLKESLEQISPDIIAAIRNEVRALFPDLAERIIRDEVDKLKKELGS